MKVYARLKSGRAWNGSHRDAGVIVHLVEDNTDPSWKKALCGTSPGIKGNGWTSPEEKEKANCVKCIKKLEEVTND